jgi:hypothetical protein
MLQAISTVAATQLSGSIVGILVYIVVHATFYFAIWEQYYTGVMRFSAFSGPTEALLGAIGIQLAAAYLGPHFWTRKLSSFVQDFAFAKNLPFSLDYEINQVIGVAFLIVAIAGLYLNIYYIFSASIPKEEYKLKGSAMRVSFPFFFLLISWVVWVYFSQSNLLQFNIVLSYSLFGLLCGYIVVSSTSKFNKQSIQVLSRVLHDRTPTFHYILLPMGLFALQSVVCHYLFVFTFI